MEGLKQKGGKVLEAAADYAETSLKIIALKTADKSARLSSNFLMIVILIIVFLFSFNMLNFGLAIIISHGLHKMWSGFVILGIFYALVGVMVYVLREKLLFQPILNSLLVAFVGTALKAQENIEEVQDKIEDKLNLEKQPD
jgi:hypothetical protein